MQISATPLKWTVAFAAGDGAKVEIPATTSDPTRFSLTLGSPPLTGQPPEVGGVPPQLEDFNGAMNQLSRFVLWQMAGGPLPYDATWAADSNVNGYPNGAQIPTADGQGFWISIADNNTVNPDTTGTNWVPGYAYGRLNLSGQTGGTVTLTPAQAVKRTMDVSGTLTSNLVIVVPAWRMEWVVTNNTTGAFTVTVKTAAGSGVVVPQNSSPTRVRGDGTNVTQLAENIAQGTQGTQPMRVDQATGRLLSVQVFSTPGSFTYTPTTGTTRVRVRVQGGGGGGGGCVATAAGQVSLSACGSSGAYCESFITSSANFSGAAVVVGASGTVASGAAGGNGGTSSFIVGATNMSAQGGRGGNNNLTTGNSTIVGTATNTATGGNLVNAGGACGGASLAFSATSGNKGFAAPSVFGLGYGCGGDGQINVQSSAATVGNPGTAGVVIVEEYS